MVLGKTIAYSVLDYAKLHVFVCLFRWFVLGSFGCMISAVVPLSQQYLPVYSQHDDMLPHLDFVLTWIFLMLNGFFYTLGSLAFVRAFEEPPKVPLLKKYKHFQSDELLGAWLFLAGTLPALPYCFVFFTIEPGMTYLTALIVAGISNMGCVLFVLGCYPSDKVGLLRFIVCIIDFVTLFS